MDYEGFRQMVLGANIYCIKSSELLKWSEGKLVNRNSKNTIL